MKKPILLLFSMAFSWAAYAFVPPDDKGIIPYDSSSQKYTYDRVIDLPALKASELYTRSRHWFKAQTGKEKFTTDEKDVKIVDDGQFDMKVYINGSNSKLPFDYHVKFQISTLFKDGKCKVVISNITLSPDAKGHKHYQPLELFETELENRPKEHDLAHHTVEDCFLELNAKMIKYLNDFEVVLKTDKIKSDEDW